MPMATPHGPPAPTDRHAVILAGGRSSRFGRDKALAPLGGHSMLEQIARTLHTAGCQIAISTSHPAHARCGYPVIWDNEPFRGPLYALRTLCEHFPHTTLFVVACDTPFITTALTEWMWMQHGDHPITLLASRHGPSPLPGLYHTGLLPIIERCLVSGAQSLRALARATPHTQIIPTEQWHPIDPHTTALLNLNTPTDLAEALGSTLHS